MSEHVWDVMRKIGVGIMVLTLVGCAMRSGGVPSGEVAESFDLEEATLANEQQNCARFEAAAIAYEDIFNPVKMQKRAIEDCRRGDPLACVAAPVAIPYTIFLGAISAPVLFPIFIMSPYTHRRACAENWSATSAGVANSEKHQPRATEKDQVSSGDRP